MKAIAIALLAAGVALLIWGIDANRSVGSSFSRTFTGNPTDRTMWLLAGGIGASAAGIWMLVRPQPR